MSLYGALLSGVAGLSAQSEALSVSSANIANVDTVGYKASQTDFATVLASSMGGGTSGAAEAGVAASAIQNVTQAGILQSASSPTDLAISGNGFFVTSASLSNTSDQYYTQAGNFSPDANGNLLNSSGYYLLGYPVTTSNGVTTTSTTLAPVNVSALAGQAEPTTTMTMQANLQSTSTVDSSYNPGDMTAGNVSPDFSRTVDVYDSQGGSQPLDFSFVETAANTWAYEVSYTGNSSNISSSNPIAEGTLSFNSDGSLANVNGASPASGNLAITIPWSASSGLASQTINVNMGTVGSTNGLTQDDTASALTAATPNGASVGTLTGVSVGTNGDVTAQYSNGLSSVISQVPIATFANADGLTAVSGTAYQTSNTSGSALINTAGTGAAGTIESSELEASTVDINTEFSNLITSQNAYSAAARILTTVDQMLQTLDQIPAT